LGGGKEEGRAKKSSPNTNNNKIPFIPHLRIVFSRDRGKWRGWGGDCVSYCFGFISLLIFHPISFQIDEPMAMRMITPFLSDGK
jgi:hypothetical protein